MINPNYYNETSVITETEYYPDGTVKQSSHTDQNDYSAMLMQNAALLQNPMGNMDPNMMGAYGTAYMDPALYQSYLQNYYTQQAYQANALGLGGYDQTQQQGLESYYVPQAEGQQQVVTEENKVEDSNNKGN